MDKHSKLLQQMLSDGILPSDALLRRLADSVGADTLNRAIAGVRRSSREQWSIVVRHDGALSRRRTDEPDSVVAALKRAGALAASASGAAREARENGAGAIVGRRAGFGMRQDSVRGTPRAVYVGVTPTSLASAGCVSRDMRSEDPRILRYLGSCKIRDTYGIQAIGGSKDPRSRSKRQRSKNKGSKDPM